MANCEICKHPFSERDVNYYGTNDVLPCFKCNKWTKPFLEREGIEEEERKAEEIEAKYEEVEDCFEEVDSWEDVVVLKFDPLPIYLRVDGQLFKRKNVNKTERVEV